MVRAFFQVAAAVLTISSLGGCYKNSKNITEIVSTCIQSGGERATVEAIASTNLLEPFSPNETDEAMKESLGKSNSKNKELGNHINTNILYRVYEGWWIDRSNQLSLRFIDYKILSNSFGTGNNINTQVNGSTCIIKGRFNDGFALIQSSLKSIARITSISVEEGGVFIMSKDENRLFFPSIVRIEAGGIFSAELAGKENGRIHVVTDGPLGEYTNHGGEDFVNMTLENFTSRLNRPVDASVTSSRLELR